MNKWIIATILPLLLLLGCSENQPQYNLTGPIDAQRTIIVEEFSGARCPNCPQGTAELDNLKSIYGDNLVIVTIHAGDFAFKYDDSKYDFTTAAGNQVLNILGNPIGYPSAVINRSRQDDQSSYQAFISRWGSLISAELEKPQSIAMQVLTSFDNSTRELTVEVRVSPLQTLESKTRLTVLLKEDDIIDPQADRAEASGVVSDYIHKNVLRDYLTSFTGDVLAERLVAFESLSKRYAYTLPPENGWWRANQITAVAFVSLDLGDDISVVEAVQGQIVP